MVNARFLWCRNCDAIHRVTPFDRSPHYHGSPDAWVEEPANDWRDFVRQHDSHRLEPMLATDDSYNPQGASVDPMGVGYFEISNGKETRLVCRSRASIEEPVRYDLVPGRLTRGPATLEIQEEAIRREMKLHFAWAPAAILTDEKIDRFLGLFRDVVRSLDPDDTRESLFESADGSLAYCELDEATASALNARCSGNFPATELAALGRFIATHRQADDVLALVKRRVLSIEQPAARLPRERSQSARR